MNLLDQLCARVRNIFFTGKLERRYNDGKIQVQLVSSDAFEKQETHFYGFKALPKEGKVFAFSQGGNIDSFELLPVIDEGKGPDLKEGDAAIFTRSGGWVICRENGEVELYGKDYGGLVKVEELQIQLAKLTTRVDGIMNALVNSSTAVNDGGATYKTGIVTALNLINDKENFSSIASNKVFHGNGS